MSTCPTCKGTGRGQPMAGADRLSKPWEHTSNVQYFCPTNCKTCKGTGHTDTCSSCDGTGSKRGGGIFGGYGGQCTRCNGAGRMYLAKKKCGHCHGTGMRPGGGIFGGYGGVCPHCHGSGNK